MIGESTIHRRQTSTNASASGVTSNHSGHWIAICAWLASSSTCDIADWMTGWPNLISSYRPDTPAMPRSL